MKSLVLDVFSKFNIPIHELDRYSEPHRYYHNWKHIEQMLIKAKLLNILTDELILAIVFHDIIYNPKADDNEEKSAELLYSYVKDDEIKQAILDTKTHNPLTDLSIALVSLDLSILYDDYESFIEFEHNIFKEYQFVDYKTYVEKRVEILKKYGVKQDWINYVKYRKPNIAVYAGSFNPFHKGHYNILRKAEQIFDKVIISRGINPDKSATTYAFPPELNYNQIDKYDGLLTDYINSLGYDVTLIRGLRNITDLQYELTQYRYLQDLKPNIKVISIFCDKEYEHISSSSIKMLEKYGKGNEYLL